MPATRNEKTDLALPLPGLVVQSCLVDHGFHLILSSGSLRAYLRVEGWVRFSTPQEGPTPEISALDHGAASIARRMVGRTVKTAAVLTDGDLAIVFEDGAKCSIESDREYHAWEILTSTGYHVVCGPGGKLAITQEQLPPPFPPAS